jgi:hypothetical protein
MDWRIAGRSSSGAFPVNDAKRRLEDVARWQVERRKLSWTEKVRLVERLLPDLRAWRDLREREARTAARSAQQRPKTSSGKSSADS